MQEKIITNYNHQKDGGKIGIVIVVDDKKRKRKYIAAIVSVMNIKVFEDDGSKH